MEEALATFSKKKFAARKIERISELAADSFGLKFCRDMFSLHLWMLLEQVSFIEAQVSDLELEIDRIMERLDSPVMTIPEIGAITGSCILGEIGDIARFSSAAKLAACAGIDATVSQSGEYLRQTNHMSKRGSPYLRKALFQSALVASFHAPCFPHFIRKSVPRENIILHLLGLSPENCAMSCTLS